MIERSHSLSLVLCQDNKFATINPRMEENWYLLARLYSMYNFLMGNVFRLCQVLLVLSCIIIGCKTSYATTGPWVYFSASTAMAPESVASSSLPTIVAVGDFTLSTTTIDIVLEGGTATSGTDYRDIATTTTITIPQGNYSTSTPYTTTIPKLLVFDDSEVESDETIILSLANPTGGLVVGSASTTTYTIQDNDGITLTGIRLSPDTVSETVVGGKAIITLYSEPDVADVIFSLVSGSGDSDNGSFAIDMRNLVINASPDYDTQSSYTIRLRVEDTDGNSSYEETKTITVIPLGTAFSSAPTGSSVGASASTGGGSRRYVCKDPQAINYGNYGKKDNGLCVYPITTNDNDKASDALDSSRSSIVERLLIQIIRALLLQEKSAPVAEEKKKLKGIYECD